MKDIKFATGKLLEYGTKKAWTFATDPETEEMLIFAWLDNYLDIITPSITVTTLIHEDLHNALWKIDPKISVWYDKLEKNLGLFVASMGVGITRAFW